ASLEREAGPPPRAPAAAGSGGGPVAPRRAHSSSTASLGADRRLAPGTAAADAPRSRAGADRPDQDPARPAGHRSRAGAIAGAARGSAAGVDFALPGALGPRPTWVTERQVFRSTAKHAKLFFGSALRAEGDDDRGAELFEAETEQLFCFVRRELARALRFAQRGDGFLGTAGEDAELGPEGMEADPIVPVVLAVEEPLRRRPGKDLFLEWDGPLAQLRPGQHLRLASLLGGSAQDPDRLLRIGLPQLERRASDVVQNSHPKAWIARSGCRGGPGRFTTRRAPRSPDSRALLRPETARK